MKALILAAGSGTRMAPLTDSIPKALVPVNGKPILIKQLENLYENGITDITVVAGYRANMLEAAVHDRFRDVNIIKNEDFRDTEDMYSAYLARDAVSGEDFIMLSADVFMDHSVIESLLAFDGENAVVTDIGFFPPDSRKVMERGGRIVELSVGMDQDEALGAAMGLYRLSAAAGEAFFRVCAGYIEDRGDRCARCAAGLNEILGEVEFRACPLHGRWFEINDSEDLTAAERIFEDE